MDVDENDTCTLLSLCARKAGLFLVNLASKESAVVGDSEALMADLGTRLFALSSSVVNAATSINSCIDEDATNLLLRLRQVFMRTEPMKLDLYYICSDIEARLDDWGQCTKEKQTRNYFLSSRSAVEDLGHLCDALRSKLSTKNWHATASLPSNIKVPKPNRYQEFINKRLFDAVKTHTHCEHEDRRECELHGLAYDIADINPWLPSRLRLGGPFQVEEWAMFDIVTSSPRGDFWNEFRWLISTTFEQGETPRKQHIKVKYADADLASHYDPPPDPSCVNPGGMCRILNPDELSVGMELQLLPDIGLIQRDSARQVNPLFPHEGANLASILQFYSPLTVKERITLSHTIAQAFWQLYASDLMQAVWTNENIWFMHEHKTDDEGEPVGDLPNELPLDAYVIFNFGDIPNAVEESRNSEHWKHPRPLPHKFPHVLALGVLLLEIGLGKPVGKQEIRSLSNRNHVVRVLSTVKKHLEELRLAEWNGFTLHQKYFISAIEYCKDYIELAHSQQPDQRTRVDSRSPSDILSGISKRKDMLYDNVIRPLAWLAHAFHENDHVTCAYSLRAPSLRRIQESKIAKKVVPSTLTKIIRSDSTWFETLREFNFRIHEFPFLNPKSPNPGCKIAILDTGYKSGMECFQEYEKRGLVKWQDFTGDSLPSEGIDEDGHGSLMATLVMVSAPLAAEIYVIRVARRRDEILNCRSNIAKAISWAGLTIGVDIISMSFGFEGDDNTVKEIKEAIFKVDNERRGGVAFFAAASNDSSRQIDMFPARDPYVIAIHATDHQGEFRFNPSIPHRILGTFSEGVPQSMLTEIKQEFPSMITDQPNSSFATAIAASIAATIFAHVLALDRVYTSKNQTAVFEISPNAVLQKLRTEHGVKKAMQGMATASGGKQNRLFLDPVAFWKKASKNTIDDVQMDANILKDIDYHFRS